jgi:hypothetical protein
VLSALAFPVKDIVCYAGMTPPATVALSNDTHPETNFLDASQFCLRDLRVCFEWATTTLAADIGQSHSVQTCASERTRRSGRPKRLHALELHRATWPRSNMRSKWSSKT